MDFLKVVSDKILNITHELVNISLASCLDQDVLVIIISETPRHLLIVHLWFILALSPSDGHLIRVNHSELPPIASPADDVLTVLVTEQLQQELPQLDGTSGAEAGTLLSTAGDSSMVTVGGTEGCVG